MKKVFYFLGLFYVLSGSLACLAASDDLKIETGAGFYIKTEYEGGKDYETWALPFLEIRYKKKYFLNIIKGLGMDIYDDSKLNFGVSLAPTFGRDASSDPRLNGLGDIDPSIDGRFFVSYKLKYCELGFNFKYDLANGYEGYTITPFAKNFIPIKKRETFLLLSMEAAYADKNYMNSFFTVTSDQAANSSLSAFKADNGFKHWGGDLTLIQKINKSWTLYTLLGYKRLINDAGNSPVVAEKNQYNGGIFVGYRF